METKPIKDINKAVEELIGKSPYLGLNRIIIHEDYKGVVKEIDGYEFKHTRLVQKDVVYLTKGGICFSNRESKK